QMPIVSSICLHVEAGREIKMEEPVQIPEASGPISTDRVNLRACVEKKCYYVGCGDSHKDLCAFHLEDTKQSPSTNPITQQNSYNEGTVDREQTQNSLKLLRSQEMLGPLTKDLHICGGSTLKIPKFTVLELDMDMEDGEKEVKGLTGLMNVGNTCYMNAALQALANCPPLRKFFFNFSSLLQALKKPAISELYQKLLFNIWHKRKSGYIVPITMVQGIQTMNPTFQGYYQHDVQEFLRFLISQLHKELKETILEIEEPLSIMTDESNSHQKDSGFKITESCSNSNKGGNTDDLLLLLNEGNNQTLPTDGQQEKNLLNKHHNACAMENLDKDDANFSSSNSAELHKQEALNEGFDSNLTSSPPRVSTIGYAMTSTIKKSVPLSFPKKKTEKTYRSIISDVFDGTIMSSVQCLACDSLSQRLESFQDLSLPIPKRKNLAKLRQGVQMSQMKKGLFGIARQKAAYIKECIKSWFGISGVTLQDCLASYFRTEKLKGGNMYSCGECKKLRKGVRFSKIKMLPEVLSLHMMRFRHNLKESTKINTHVSFPLEGLELRPFLTKHSPCQVTTYDLISLICHRGNVNSGHYIAYCRKDANTWYQYDDHKVSEVSEATIQKEHAYILLYKKSSEAAHQVSNLLNLAEPNAQEVYISKQWLSKFQTFAEPGPISNTDFMCIHGGIPPHKVNYIEDLVVSVPQNTWAHLQKTYRGGPEVNHLHVCEVCHTEAEDLQNRRKLELETFFRLNKEFQKKSPEVLHCINMQWMRRWERFVKAKDNDPPGLINNHNLTVKKSGRFSLIKGPNFAHISKETRKYFHSIYGGGPQI
uniref:Ubiquitin carboxyl-terminal hydrolase n=1 Tax=Latimeria chalumnae TaxID=7897 RepID=H2ZYD5_LATCH